MKNPATSRSATGRDCLTGGSEMGALIRSMDWSKTPIGDVETWSPALRMMVRLVLANRFPLLLWWGPRYCQLYNDAYRPVLGDKHPASMGQPASEPTAALCFNDVVALGVIEAIQLAGLKVGAGFGVIGFNDVSADTEPALTTIDTAPRQLGETAAELLLRRIKKPDSLYPDNNSSPAINCTRVLRNFTLTI